MNGILKALLYGVSKIQAFLMQRLGYFGNC